jgi:hypothetical protein
MRLACRKLVRTLSTKRTVAYVFSGMSALRALRCNGIGLSLFLNKKTTQKNEEASRGTIHAMTDRIAIGSLDRLHWLESLGSSRTSNTVTELQEQTTQLLNLREEENELLRVL